MKLPSDGSTPPVLQIARAKRTEVKPQRAAKTQVVRHRVKRGETVVQIARRYGASAERILEANGMRRANLLQVGALLLIPRK
jgi:nucleoid-associated protein YgaU